MLYYILCGNRGAKAEIRIEMSDLICGRIATGNYSLTRDMKGAIWIIK
mgnify:CR=1 FL=1